MRPNLASRVATAQAQQKAKKEHSRKERQFNVGYSVFVRNLTSGPNWVPGTIVALRGPLSFDVELSDQRSSTCGSHSDSY